MPSQNLEKLKRESLISEILSNKITKIDSKNIQNSLFVDLNGKLKIITAETVEFLKYHFNISLKKEESVFQLIPIESLKEVLDQFNETLHGYATSTTIKSTITNSNIRIRKILKNKDGTSFVKIDLAAIDPLTNRDPNSALTETPREVEILNETSQVFESLFNNHPDAIYSFDLEGYFTSANESASKLGEIAHDKLSQHKVMEVIPKDDVARVIGHFKKAARGEVQNYNTNFKSFKGTDRIINVTNFPIFINGKINGVFGIAKDITKAEYLKKKAKDLDNRYKMILDQSLDVICTIDKNGRFVDINKSCYKMWGYTPKELKGKKFQDLVMDEDKEHTELNAQEIMQGIDKTNFSNRYIKKDGSVIPMVWSAKWVEEEQLNFCIAKNASEMNAVKSKLEEERNILRAIIDNIPDYVFVKNINDELILANKKFYSDYLGKTSEADLLGLKPTEYLSKELGEEIIKDNRLVMENDLTVINRKDVVYDHKGKKEVILLTKVPFKTKKGAVIGLVGIARNITENHEFEQEQKISSKLIDSLSISKNLKQGLRETIQAISEFFNFDYAQAWEIGIIDHSLNEYVNYNKQKNKSFISEYINSNSPIDLATLALRSQQIEISSGNKTKSILIAVPVIFDKKVIQVLTFYGLKRDREVNVITEILNRLSLQISSNIQRKIAESQLNNLFQYSPNLIAVIGMDGYMKKVSPSFTKIFGYTEEELLSTPYHEFLHPEEVALSFKRLKEVTQGYVPKSYEGRCRTKEGEWKWISWTPSEIITDDGVINLFGLDITPLKTANLEMLKFKNIIENSSEGVTIIDLETEEFYFNSAFKQIIGNEISNLNIVSKIKKSFKDKTQGEDVFNRLLDGKPWSGDIQLINASENVLDYQFSGGPVFNQNNELIAIYGIHTDITDRKNYENELKRFNDRVNNILESITDGFFSMTRNWIITYFNTEAERLLRIPKETIINKNLWEYFPDAKTSISFKNYSKAFETGKKVSFEDYFEPYDTWFEVNAYPSAEGLSVYFKDVTTKKRAGEEIRIAKERYDLITKVTHEAIYDWDIPKNTMEWSKAYFSTYGYEIPELVDGLEHWENQLHPEYRDEVIASLEEALENSSVYNWEYEYKLIKANKETSIVMDRGLITRNKEGFPIRMIGSLQDISQIRQNAISLEQLNTKLKNRANELATSNAELEQFAYIASHDLQEPLRMVTSFLTQLNKKYKDQLDPKAQQYIYYATDGAVRMRQILLDLLEYSRVGRMNYQFEEVDLNTMIKEICNLHRDLILEARGEIIFSDLPKINAAPIPLQRVLSNLISNALKYQQSEINAIIKIEVLDAIDYWQIDVTDNGIGIEEQFFDKIFVVFQRLHGKDKYSGTGIGLSICKKIIEKHSGEIWVSSKINKGSTFHITIKKQN
ncbi:PAS domain S-box-containing protein [Gillisia mitskevichiae]|uniref:histidine kinase n=1 Tax=Gillisia mitskevichiae TaxID=270921 RepID=A0A495PIJ7_9FLAO|nr:PAS domain S-box protein [Gillisia mitskevichiae]RKS50564.1 PAS domain S-box-containing protein [Gillisia mitskevichiae]